MNAFASRIAIDWHKALEDVLSRAKKFAAQGIVVFDLDSTLFDNRPRQARILREFGKERGIAALMCCQAFHFADGWDVMSPMVACGMTPSDAAALHDDLRHFWRQRFFSSEYCREDIEIVGAPRYLRRVAEAQAQIAYVTGRHEGMRQGTIECLIKCQMLPPSESVKLFMKPAEADGDDAFKCTTHEKLAQRGAVLATFDNEPLHINNYAKRFVEATAVHLATDDSRRQIQLLDSVVSVPHFAY